MKDKIDISLIAVTRKKVVGIMEIFNEIGLLKDPNFKPAWKGSNFDRLFESIEQYIDQFIKK